MNEQQFDPMAAADGFRDFVAMITGLKRQLIDAGWSEASAEELAIEACKQSNRINAGTA